MFSFSKHGADGAGYCKEYLGNWTISEESRRAEEIINKCKTKYGRD